MPRSYISLGGNLGAVADTFADALDRLQKVRGNSVVAVSRFVETKAVGESADGPFLNAAAGIDTELPPLELLDLLQSVEHELGRRRSVHWGPRTLDLDIIFYDSEILTLSRLTVPHPAAWYRRFVLDPLVEIAPEFVHPEKRATVELLRARLLRRPLVAAFVGGEPQEASALIRTLEPRFPDATFRYFEGTAEASARLPGEPALTFWLGSRSSAAQRVGDDFERLPLVSRIDVTATSEPVGTFVKHILQSALG
jgi:2-amino-4-hydroxy-6-hydroxymethyldihydropteridine diphosphokinase